MSEINVPEAPIFLVPSLSMARNDLRTLIRMMQTLGVLDGRFDILRAGSNNYRSLLSLDLMNKYFQQIQSDIEKISKQKGHGDLDYNNVLCNTILLKEGSARIGGAKLEAATHKLYLALSDLQREKEDLASNSTENNQKRCLTAFERVKEEFKILHDCLEEISSEHDDQENTRETKMEKFKPIISKYLDGSLLGLIIGIGVGIGFSTMMKLFGGKEQGTRKEEHGIGKGDQGTENMVGIGAKFGWFDKRP